MYNFFFFFYTNLENVFFKQLVFHAISASKAWKFFLDNYNQGYDRAKLYYIPVIT